MALKVGLLAIATIIALAGYMWRDAGFGRFLLGFGVVLGLFLLLRLPTRRRSIVGRPPSIRDGRVAMRPPGVDRMPRELMPPNERRARGA